MAHFAQLNDENVVVRVLALANDACKDADGVEQESVGVSVCTSLFGGRWVQTSYNGRIRKNFAGRGYVYDAERDAFIPPRRFASWTLNESTCRWEPPVPHPQSGMRRWNESLRQWESAS